VAAHREPRRLLLPPIAPPSAQLGTAEGARNSALYSEGAFLLSCKLHLLLRRSPPAPFEELIDAHYRATAQRILKRCRAVIDERRPPEGTPPVRAASAAASALRRARAVNAHDGSLAAAAEGWAGRGCALAFSPIAAPLPRSPRPLCSRRARTEPYAPAAPRPRSTQVEGRALCSEGLVCSLRRLMPRLEEALGPYARAAEAAASH
jgi:hypothetical protein